VLLAQRVNKGLLDLLGLKVSKDLQDQQDHKATKETPVLLAQRDQLVRQDQQALLVPQGLRVQLVQLVQILLAMTTKFTLAK
jgi:hypothetical protein